MTPSNRTDISLPVVKKRTHNRMRWAVLVTVQILIIVHIVIWLLGKKYGWFGGRTLTPIEPSEGMEFVKKGIVNAGAIFFALALLSTLFFGRWFCGWGCHIVLLQDWCYWLMRKVGVRPKPFRARFLMWFPFGLAVYMFVWPLFYRFVIAKVQWPGITTHLLTEDYWSSFASPIIAIPFLLVCGFATVYVLGAKGFCTYGCPYGGFFKPLDAVSPMHVRVNDDCGQCGKCTAACTSNVRVHEEVNLYKMVIDSGCMKIMDCVDACPNNALHIGFGKIAVGQRKKKRKYDLSLPEEFCIAVVFLISFFAYRSLYALIPMLMAVGIALVVTWILWKCWRILQEKNVSFHSKQLKFHGNLKQSGVLFLLLGVLVAIITLHSAVIQTFKFAGDYATARNNTKTAMRFYHFASPISDGGYALASNPNIDFEIARYEESELNFQKADQLFRRLDARAGGDEQTTMLIAHNLQNYEQFEPIDSFYAIRLQNNPSWELVWEDYIGWLKRESIYEQAVATSRAAVELNPKAKRLRIQLSLLELEHGSSERGIFTAESLINDYSNDPAIWMLYARALDSAGRRNDAKIAIERANQIQLELLRPHELD